MDHMARRTLVLDRVRYVVLDEADRMLDLGFRDDIRDILNRCPKERQTVLLSATMPSEVLRLAQRYQRDPLHINLSPEKPTVECIRQFYITVDKEKKLELLLRLALRERPKQAIIFCERKIASDPLYEKLPGRLPRRPVLHRHPPPPGRARTTEEFHDGTVPF